MCEEIWKPIAGYEGLYQVSNCGRVRRLWKTIPPQIRKLNKSRNGYLLVDLWRDGKEKRCSIHRLVAIAFIPNPENKPEVDHINNIKTDNRVENLRWVTFIENQQYATEDGLRRQGEKHGRARLTNEQVEYIRENPDDLTIRQLAEMFGVCKTTIADIQRNKTYKNVGGSVRDKIDRRISDKKRNQIRSEHAQGLSVRVIAKKHGVGKSTVQAIIHEVDNHDSSNQPAI